jgi:transposase
VAKRGRKPRERRWVLTALLSVVRTGGPWQALPQDFPKWQPVATVFWRGRQPGVWKRVHDALRAQVRKQGGKKPTPPAAIIESQRVKTTEVGGPERELLSGSCRAVSPCQQLLKSALGMDILRGKTPEMVRKEVWMHLLAYNLIRTVMAQGATQAGLLPRTLSFTGARQALEAFREALLLAGARRLASLLAALFGTVVAHRVGQRPDRCEPRAVKRRRKPHPLLTVPRQQAKARLLHRRAA